MHLFYYESHVIYHILLHTVYIYSKFRCTPHNNIYENYILFSTEEFQFIFYSILVKIEDKKHLHLADTKIQIITVIPVFYIGLLSPSGRMNTNENALYFLKPQNEKILNVRH